MACKTCEAAEHSYDEKPFVPPNGSVHQLIFVCPDCGQHWWQFNDYYHLWKATDAGECAAAVRNQMLSPYFDMQ